MRAKFYNCERDEKYVFKLSPAEELNHTPIDIEILTPGNNVVKPTLRLQSGRLADKPNFVYIYDLKRFYYILTWDMENGYITAKLECDVLMSWRKPLMDTEVLIQRNEKKRNAYLVDDQLKTYAPTRVKTIPFENGFPENDPQFYLAVTSAEGSGGGGDVPSGGSNYSLYVIAAMCGNFWTESNINPAIWENLDMGSYTDLYKGYGIGQWTNVEVNGRLQTLNQWITSNGYNMYDGNAQLQYIKKENYWIRNNSFSFQNLTEFLQSESTDLDMLTNAWTRCWEGITPQPQRRTQAATIYSYLEDHKDDSGLSWVKGNRYLTEAEIKNNAVLVYQFFNGTSS